MKKICAIALLVISVGFGQENGDEKKNKHRFVFEPDSLSLNIGETGTVTVKFVDVDGNLVKNPFYIYGRPRRTLESKPRISDSTGVATVTIKPYKAGKLSLSVRSISQKREDRITGSMPVEVPFPALDRIVFNDPVSSVYVGTYVNYETEVFDKANMKREESKVLLSSSNTDIADLDLYGNLVAKKAGKITLTASVEDIKETISIKVAKNPVRKISLSADQDKIRTGDVLQFKAKAMNRSGRAVKDIPITFSFTGTTEYGIGLPTSALINDDGKFVAETPGIFTVLAESGGFSARKTIEVVKRDIRKIPIFL